MSSFENYRELIEREIKLLKLPDKPARLYEPVRYILALGGKRLRPALCLLSCEIFGGKSENALPAALALEVFHNFTLVHDDLLDRADMRRSKPTVHKKWDFTSAILSGDVMLVLAFELLCRNGSSHLRRIIDLFNRTAKEVCEGQQLDMDFEKREDVSIPEYLEMIGLKTAVLLACSLKMGAMLADVEESQSTLLYDFGYNTGIAFQLQDDLLDAYGRPEFGKAVGGDITANKKTYLTLKALELADRDTRKTLLALFSDIKIASEEKIASVMGIYEKMNIRELTEKIRDDYFRKGMDCLDKLQPAPEGLKALRELAEQLLNREH